MISRRLLSEILSTFLEPKTHAKITDYAIKYSLENIAVGNSKQERINNLTLYFSKKTDDPKAVDTAFELIKELIDKEVSFLHERQLYDEYDVKSFEDTYPLISRLLQQDGLSIIDDELKYHVPKMVNIPSSQEEIFVLLDKYKFSTPSGHLRQAMDGHANGKWASANGQLRTYVEGLFDEMAEQIYGEAKVKGMSSHERKIELSKTTPPIFDVSLNEWDTAKGKGFINGFWKRLCPEGPHPGLSDLEDATFRLHLVLLVTANILKRFDGYMKNKKS
ncbi:hypothetical protein M4D76_16205 [Peribacillus frigoritolerans]|uniref:hypothetical protein n=1 Tax=Peribacillus frigoritolerans TaxID=450367 RepID=UPI0021A9116E|nr:hypothetical protein [Peribacillus frigoritolerans]MCT1389839.1 hypothetical protein [Peribacillus frigoritolerans]